MRHALALFFLFSLLITCSGCYVTSGEGIYHTEYTTRVTQHTTWSRYDLVDGQLIFIDNTPPPVSNPDPNRIYIRNR